MAAVVHHEDRVLVADDGRVPMVEVDDAVAVSDASLTADYYWLLKVSRLLAVSECIGVFFLFFFHPGASEYG